MGKCNCHEWAQLGSYSCPVHGYENKYRKEMEEKQPCGHPKSAIVSDEEGTCYCGACEDRHWGAFEKWYEKNKGSLGKEAKDIAHAAYLGGKWDE